MITTPTHFSITTTLTALTSVLERMRPSDESLVLLALEDDTFVAHSSFATAPPDDWVEALLSRTTGVLDRFAEDRLGDECAVLTGRNWSGIAVAIRANQARVGRVYVLGRPALDPSYLPSRHHLRALADLLETPKPSDGEWASRWLLDLLDGGGKDTDVAGTRLVLSSNWMPDGDGVLASAQASPNAFVALVERRWTGRSAALPPRARAIRSAPLSSVQELQVDYSRSLIVLPWIAPGSVGDLQRHEDEAWLAQAAHLMEPLAKWPDIMAGIEAQPEGRRSELLHTLAVLIATNMDNTAAAARLFLHVNSVRYRRTQIERLLGRDFARGVDVLVVSCALLMRHPEVLLRELSPDGGIAIRAVGA